MLVWTPLLVITFGFFVYGLGHSLSVLFFNSFNSLLIKNEKTTLETFLVCQNCQPFLEINHTYH